MILTILFWILWLLCIIACCVAESPFVSRGRWVVALIMIGILGFKLLGDPTAK
jgi:hypothetical protein